MSIITTQLGFWQDGGPPPAPPARAEERPRAVGPVLALSVRQPWAYLIMSGAKTVENRTWPTKHRGGLVIHAGLNRADYKDMVKTNGLAKLEENCGLPELTDADFGVLMAVVDLVDCVPLAEVQEDDQLYADGPWCWILRSPRAIAPIEFAGKLGLFKLPPEVAEQIVEIVYDDEDGD